MHECMLMLIIRTSLNLLFAHHQELALYQRLSHPNVVQYLGHHYGDDKCLYIFLEYVAGGSVSSVLASFGPLNEHLVRTYTRQIVEGLVYVHAQG